MPVSEDLTKRLLYTGLDRWHSRTGLLLVMAAILVVGVCLFAGLNISDVSPIEWAIIGGLILGAWLLWFATRIERTPRGRVGIGVAIEFENDDQARRLRSDFIVTLRNLLNASRHKQRFALIEYRQSTARRTTSEDQAAWLMQKARLTLLIHGRARQRTMPGSADSHVLDISWMVQHRRIPSEHSQELAKDVGSVVPGRLVFGMGAGEMLVVEFGAQLVDAVARYVIGTVAIMGADYEYAEELLLDAEKKLTSYVKGTHGAPVATTLGKVQKRLGDLYLVWMARLTLQFSLGKRDRESLARAESLVPKLRTYDPDSYHSKLTAAMAAFLLRRDVAAARAELTGCKLINDATWRFSDAFLLAYEGDLEGSYRAYLKAFESPLSDVSVLVQCEEFIQIVIDEEPDRPWLYYCLGLLNHRGKHDLTSARKDFSTFVERSDDSRFHRQREAARKWIAEIDASARSSTNT